MQLEGVTIALRARSPWEATDLGIALVRAHAGRIFTAWLAITLPVFVLLNAASWLLDNMWIAFVAMLWLKPAFDRVPLFVLSRAVFGAPPSLRETLRAQWQWGRRGILPWLLWRRLHFGRAMLLPVDLLEGLTGARRRERVNVLSRASGSPNAMLTVIGFLLGWMLAASIVVLGLMFVPIEFLSDSAKAVWQTLFEHPPAWALLLINAIVWIGMSVVEPFYIGAGFGLYLNRRTQLEGWDIELAFRRLAARLAQPLAVIVLAIGSALVCAPCASADETQSAAHDARSTAPAADTAQPGKAPPVVDKELTDRKAKAKASDSQIVEPLEKVFADQYRDDGAEFEAAVKQAYTDGDLSPQSKEMVWKRRHPLEDSKIPDDAPAWARAFGQLLSFIVQYGLWILLAILLILIIANHKRWLPWISDRFERDRALDDVDVREITVPDNLPDDIPAAVRALWRQGRPRAALALLYRAGVKRLTDTLGSPLPPGATESECLRHARRLPDGPYATLFPRIVRCWQAAAYAQRIPLTPEVESLLNEWGVPGQASP